MFEKTTRREISWGRAILKPSQRLLRVACCVSIAYRTRNTQHVTRSRPDALFFPSPLLHDWLSVSPRLLVSLSGHCGAHIGERDPADRLAVFVDDGERL